MWKKYSDSATGEMVWEGKGGNDSVFDLILNALKVIFWR